MILRTETSESLCRAIVQAVKDLEVKCNKLASRIPEFGELFYSQTVGAK